MTSPVHQLYPDEHRVEAPGEEFKLTSYIRDLGRAGVAVHIGAAMGALVALAGHANKQRECWPKQTALVKETGFSRRSIVNHIDALVALGAIHKVKLPVEQGRRGKWRNGYQLAPVSNIVAVCERRERNHVQDVARGRARPRAESCAQPCATLGSSGEAHLYMEERQEEGTKESAAPRPVSTTYNTPPQKRRRTTVCRDADEERERETFLALFDARIHPITVGPMQGRYRNEALRALRLHGLDTLSACLCAMAASKRFVLKDWVSPITVSNNVLVWQEAGSPATWEAVERYAAMKARRQGGR